MIHPLQTLYRKDEKGLYRGAIPVEQNEAQDWNNQGWGIYVTANSFRKDVTKEEHRSNDTKTNRNTQYINRLLYAYIDMDAVKTGENITPQELYERKNRLWCALWDGDCPEKPDMCLDTRNGFQPLWLVDADPTESNIQDYKKFICGMISWSEKHGSYGDPVKDVCRLIRCPNYNHMKQDPYFVSLVSHE